MHSAFTSIDPGDPWLTVALMVGLALVAIGGHRHD